MQIDILGENFAETTGRKADYKKNKKKQMHFQVNNRQAAERGRISMSVY